MPRLTNIKKSYLSPAGKAGIIRGSAIREIQKYLNNNNTSLSYFTAYLAVYLKRPTAEIEMFLYSSFSSLNQNQISNMTLIAVEIKTLLRN